MKRLNKNTFSLLISVVTGIVVLAVALVFHFTSNDEGLLLMVLLPVISAAGVYVIIRFLLMRFIRAQIGPIYHTVHGINPVRNNEEPPAESDLINEIEEEVKEWAEQRKKEARRFKELESYRKEFLGNVYHELKTPIFNIQGYILTLLEGGLNDKAINKRYLERAGENIDRIISIVEDLESISRLEPGSINLKMEKFNIRRVIEEVIDSNEERAEVREVSLEIGKAKESLVMVMADRRRIHQVLNNLVINSINYGTINGKTSVTYSLSGNKVIIEVRDNGIGIGKDDIPRVFERFYRVDKSRSRNTGGTGLGLSIVKHILEAHKQTIKLTSEPGKGSVFSFTLEKA